MAAAVLALTPGFHSAVAQNAPGSAIHGSLDESLSTTYITPRGLLESNTNVTSFTTATLSTSLFSSKDDFAKDVSIHAGVLFNLYSHSSLFNTGNFRELDWWTGTTLTLQDNVTLGIEFSQFVSPIGLYATDNNLEFSAISPALNISKAITITPYGKLFWNVSGASVTVTGQEGQFDVELGAKMAVDLNSYNIPVVLTVPTWFTVGPSSFWGGGGNFGVITTGLTATTPLSFIPSRYGSWYADISGQYYHILNNQLLVAQREIGVDQQRNIVAATAGIGFTF